MITQSRKKKNTFGRWSRAENNKFMDALEKYGRNWQKIQKKIKNRTILQIRSHAQKIFLNMSQHDIQAFIGYDQPKQSFELSIQGLKVIRENIKTGRKNQKVLKATKKIQKQKAKRENQCFQDCNKTQISSKLFSQTPFINSPEIIVSQIINKETNDNSQNQTKISESIFLRTFKENSIHFLNGGDFYSLVWEKN